MSRVRDAFADGKAFIPFVTAGDPELAVTEELIVAMAEAGADLIEIGIPFSDPVAEGIVIQEADILLSYSVNAIYINPIFVYGSEKFIRTAAETGIDALIVPDMPFEEKGELLPLCRQYGLDLISLIAPTSKERIHAIAKEAEGFVYCVSSMGVTGVRTEITTNIGEMVSLVKEAQSIPCAIGFGISTPEQAKKMSEHADGVIVGSAIVRMVAKYGKDCVEPVCQYIREMKAAIS